MFEKIIYTLGKLNIKGRESLRACVACMNTLSNPENCNEDVLKAVLDEMNNITVIGEDASRLLGCMQAAEQLIEEVKHRETHDE